jgi:hypothetical protein
MSPVQDPLIDNSPRHDGTLRGQAAVELALITRIVLFVMLVGIQFAIIGTAALGLGQADYQGGALCGD